MQSKRLIIVSGLSGSGKSVALHTLEDLGYYCIDNLPPFLLRELVPGLEGAEGTLMQNTAVGIDARSHPEQLAELPLLVAELRARDFDCQVLYLEAQPEAQEMLAQIQGFVQRWLPNFEDDQRSYLTVALGCTGGQHRSVYAVEWLARRFEPRLATLVRHRELDARE